MPQVAAYYVVAASVFFFLLGWTVQRLRGKRLVGDARELQRRIIDDAEREAATCRKAAEVEAREELIKVRSSFAEETDRLRAEHSRRLENLDLREANLSKKVAFIDQKETRLEHMGDELKSRQEKFDVREDEIKSMLAEQQRQLERISGLSGERAKEILMENMMADARHSAAKSIKGIREETERTSRREAQKILSLAIQRYASDHVAEESVALVDLPNDEMKGRIIGREGRNIRAFELATGVDVIIDDTPEAVIISAFDPVRREIARIALRILVKDGRIHPGRIEEVVDKTRKEIMERIIDIGERTCLDVGLQDINPDMLVYIGRLHYRTSYGQNMLLHCREVAAISSVIAGELGLDQKLARRCGFLHDIGKAVDHEVDGPHAEIGGRICRKFGETDIVVNAVAGHHQDIEAISPYTFITAAADAVSASRPGARRESIENYVKRLEALEKVANSFDGVEKSYAIQAGREIRILVNHKQVSDAEAALLAEEISRRVEGELEYPGQIKVMVIRETRSTAYAR